MQAAFVLVESEQPGAGREQLSLRTADAPFAPGASITWSDRSGRLRLMASQDAPGSQGLRWHATAETLTLVIGTMRAAGSDWTPEATWAAAVAEAVTRRTIHEVLDTHDGAWLLAHLRRDGFGWIATDPLGLRFLYRGEHAGRTSYASTARLAAAGVGRAADRDPLGPCSLAHTRHLVTDRAGFVGVRLLPVSTTVELQPAAPSRLRARRPPWRARSPGGDPVQDHLSEARQALTASVRAAVAAEQDRCLVDLTGGKDSRLVLALLLSEGLAERCQFRTVGGPGLEDVRVASELAARTGIDHSAGLVIPDDRRPYAERARAFVERTGGTTNLWYLKTEPTSPEGVVHLSGKNGEILRCHRYVPAGARSAAGVRRILQRIGFGSLGLLDPQLAAPLDERCAALLDQDAPADPIDRLAAFFARTALRQLNGPIEEGEPVTRSMPLCSAAAVRAAFALGGERRQADAVHRHVIAMAAPELVDVRLTGPGWHTVDRVGSPYRSPDDLGHRRADSAPRSPSRPEALRARGHRRAGEERRSLLEDLLAEGANPAWDLIDRTALRDAVARYEELGTPERQQLMGAATAALWLGS